MEMIGATVLQKGTNNGIVTGLDGKFTLTLSNKAEQTLLISMIGFIEQSIAIKKNHPFINITLEEDIAQLDEVVVVGYGTQKKVSLTGSISNVGTEDSLTKLTGDTRLRSNISCHCILISFTIKLTCVILFCASEDGSRCGAAELRLQSP
jgi:hypothetical protein